MRALRLALVLTCLLPLARGAENAAAAQPKAHVEKSVFGQTPEGVDVESYTLTNKHGSFAKILTFGATIATLQVPDRNGRLGSVVRDLTTQTPSYARALPSAASVQGRVANRIRNATFSIDGQSYKLAANNGPHTLHGGIKNFSRALWKAEPIAAKDGAAVKLTYRSVDGEEGFPGNMDVTIVYTLTDSDTLRIEYSATTDKPSPINLTNHAYFNLNGGGDVRDYEVLLACDRYTVFDKELIPTGEIRSVVGTPFDFTKPAKFSAHTAEMGPRPRYDQNFVVNRPDGDTSLRFFARISDPTSGRVLEGWTTEPGMQIYTSILDGGTAGGGGGGGGFGGGFQFFCLETQHHPDSINRPEFPSALLRPGQTFRSTTEYRFSAK